MRKTPPSPGLLKAIKDGVPDSIEFKTHRDLRFDRLILRNADFSGLNLGGCTFGSAKLQGAKFRGCNLHYADFTDARLQGSDFYRAGLKHTRFVSAKLAGADLTESNLVDTDFTGADLSSACLVGTRLVRTNIERAKLGGCRIYGLAAWDIKGKPKDQTGLIVTPAGAGTVTVDSLEMAQAIHLLGNYKNMKKLIDVYSSKVVLILGSFEKQRKKVLGGMRVKLASMNYAPIVFDFDEPRNRDKTETVLAIASISHCVIVDITDTKSSIGQELQTIMPNLPSVPVCPVLMERHKAPSLFSDLKRRRRGRVSKTFHYKNKSHLLSSLGEIVPRRKKRR